MNYSVRRQGTQGVSVSEFEWTKDAPKVPGWYWAKKNGYYDKIEVVQVSDREGGLVALRTEENAWWMLSNFTFWLGPIPEPFAKGF